MRASGTGSGSSGILVLEAHPVTRRGICRLIDETPGLRLDGRADSLEAVLRLLSDRRTEGIALVMVEPLALGSEFRARVAELVRASRVPVLALSARTEQGFVKQIMSAGAAGFVSKNEPPSSVIASIERVIGGERILAGVTNDEPPDEAGFSRR